MTIWENTRRKPMDNMKKLTTAILAAAVAVAAWADICRQGAPRGVRFPDLRVRMYLNDRHGFEVTEDAALFYARFATVDYPDFLNYAEHRQMAVAVARTVADCLGSTNDIRIVHWEQPEPASTNIVDVIAAKLKGRYVTDEIVPIGRKENNANP